MKHKDKRMMKPVGSHSGKEKGSKHGKEEKKGSHY